MKIRRLNTNNYVLLVGFHTQDTTSPYRPEKGVTDYTPEVHCEVAELTSQTEKENHVKGN